jgi:phospholipase C
VYYGDIPQSLLLVHQLSPRNIVNYHHIPQFITDAAGDPAAFPTFSFIEPEYNPPGQNDDHPPHDVLAGDQLIADVYNALRANERLFSESLLVVTWDEHGGFYDHVAPVGLEPPDSRKGDFGFDFRRSGLRVPALLISPFSPPTVNHTVFDHTSVLRFVSDLFALAPLTNRVTKANTLGVALSAAARPMETLPEVISTISPLPVPLPRPAPDTLNPNQSGLVAYAQYLGTETKEDPVKATERTPFMMTSARAQIDVACDHNDRLIRAARSSVAGPSSGAIAQP